MTLAEMIKTGSLTYVKSGTSKAESLNRKWKYREGGYYLRNIYGTNSYAKQVAWEYCITLEHELRGNLGSFVSHNIFQFTWGFTVKDDNNVEYVVIITKSNNYITELQ